jgi:hypothetical protein
MVGGSFSGQRGPGDGVTFAAQWDMLAHGWTDIGNGVMLPEQFTARFIVRDDHTVEMDIATEQGVPVCNSVRVLRHPNRPSLTGHELRRFPLGDWVTFACSMVGVGNQGSPTTSAEWTSEQYRADVERVVRRSRRRNTITDEFLRDVARVYKANASSAPVEAVEEAFIVAYSTAARYVKLARDRGFLPKTTRGKVTSN